MNNHPNKQPFIGILAIVDQPSDKSPAGARGHRVFLPLEVAKRNLPSLVEMGINIPLEGFRHQATVKSGIIESAEISGDKIIVSGYIFGRDCPGVLSYLQASSDLGMSYEIMDAHVSDMREEVWILSQVTFTGASVLPRSVVAYKTTEFILVRP